MSCHIYWHKDLHHGVLRPLIEINLLANASKIFDLMNVCMMCNACSNYHAMRHVACIIVICEWDSLHFLLFSRGDLSEDGFLDRSGSWCDQVSFPPEDTIKYFCFYYYTVHIVLSCRVFALLTGEEGLIYIFFQIKRYLREIAELLVFAALRCKRISRGNFRWVTS